MMLSKLLKGVNVLSEYNDTDIKDIKNNSKLVGKNDLYIAIKGTNADGHSYVGMALENGAAAVIVERDMGVKNQVIVDNTKHAYAIICANYFDNPSKKLKLVGVTGTNGKTSVTTIVKSILEYCGYTTGLIGTIRIEYADTVKPNPNTTPDAYLFQSTLNDMVNAGCKYAVSEISSHALAQDRIYGCHFDVAAFTNLTQDHLDYHKDMEDYFLAKTKLFSMCDKAVINISDPYGKRLKKMFDNTSYGFSVSDKDAYFYADNILSFADRVEFNLNYNGKTDSIRFAIPGLYSVENALTAIGICDLLGIEREKIINGLATVNGISGRSEILYSDAQKVLMRDYAHTPDGIENILSSVKGYAKGRVVALFGCGGDRDRLKRPLMAKACEKYADFIIVTSDNPRSEEPDAIIDDIIKGFDKATEYIRITDRYKAIEYAVDNAQQDDTIVLLGKGHEDYQILKDKTIHFDEKEVVNEIMAARNTSQEANR